MAASIPDKEMIESMTKEEIYDMWIAENKRRVKLMNENIFLKTECEIACKNADKYRKFWREEIAKR